MSKRLCLTMILTTALTVASQAVAQGGVGASLHVETISPKTLFNGDQVFSAKFLCGRIPAAATDPETPAPGFPLVPGTYRSAINVHNPNPFPIRFEKKAVEAKRQGEPPSEAGTLVSDRLDPDGALEIDCDDITEHLLPQPAPCPGCPLIAAQFVKGFVVIVNVRDARPTPPGGPQQRARPAELDVVGVYTLKNVERAQAF